MADETQPPEDYLTDEDRVHNTYVTQADLLELKLQLDSALSAIVKPIADRLEILEGGQDANDKQMGVLAIGFGELSVLLEAVVGALDFETDEKRQAFFRRQDKSRKDMFKALESFSDELAKSNPGAAAAVEHGVERHQPPAPDTGDSHTGSASAD